MPSAEHEGITGVTFDSEGHRLLGTLYIARGCAPKPAALLLHGCPGLQQNADLAVALRDRGWNSQYVQIDGANHDFAWHRGPPRELVCGWLDGTDV